MPPFSLKNATRTQISIRSSIIIHFYTGVTPATYRLDAFRINYRKGDLIGTYVYFAFQKPFRESPSSGTSHSRSRGKLHDRNGKMTATKIPRSAGDVARLCARYHLPSSRDGAECHYAPQKQFTRRQQQQADNAHPSLIKLRGFGLSAGHFTLSHYAELFSETENDALSAIESSLSLGIASATLYAIRGRSSCFPCENTKRAARSSKPQVFSQKCAPASSLSSASCSLGVTSTPFSHCTAPWRSSSSPTSSSSFPTPQSTSPPPDTWLPVPNHHFQARKKTPPCGRVFSFSGC